MYLTGIRTKYAEIESVERGKFNDGTMGLERDYGNIACSSAAVIVDNLMHSIQTHSELPVVNVPTEMNMCRFALNS